ncbi:MAG: hypothetical protein M0031_02960 [Thermaerobacter sp.]|nr:hypothetical protein [Thermaerobacter sp.]
MRDPLEGCRENLGQELREAMARRFPGAEGDALLRLSGSTMLAAEYLKGLMGIRPWPGVEPDAKVRAALEKALGCKLHWLPAGAVTGPSDQLGQGAPALDLS